MEKKKPKLGPHPFDQAEFTEIQAKIAIVLTSHKHLKKYKFQRENIFTYGGRSFIGVYENVVVDFLKNNPTGGDFYVWLQQQKREVSINLL